MDTVKNMGMQLDHAIDGNSNKVEGAATKKIEKVSSTVPSGAWLVLGGGAMLGSIVLKVMGRGEAANFVGQWVPTMLMLGLYNKIVKVMGSDRATQHAG